jgi:hypothetical protein
MTKPNFLHFAFCILHFAFILTFPACLFAQQTNGFLAPSCTLTNQTNDTLFCLPKQKLETLMEREEISFALINSLKEHNAISDSLLNLKTREAENWYSKLVETDVLLEESELLRIQGKQKDKLKAKIWFGVGTVAGFLIGIVL